MMTWKESPKITCKLPTVCRHINSSLHGQCLPPSTCIGPDPSTCIGPDPSTCIGPDLLPNNSGTLVSKEDEEKEPVPGTLTMTGSSMTIMVLF
jgi:hypothetical protein